MLFLFRGVREKFSSQCSAELFSRCIDIHIKNLLGIIVKFDFCRFILFKLCIKRILLVYPEKSLSGEIKMFLNLILTKKLNF